ncbi:class I SAM-dependent methyltransferase [Arthrobacter sp. zg-Y1171]|uniref:class I SAM-dependent methyltransferase n=1 Tax=Arthrobacter sp. zg-Y1171 TaxID=2964610 RepID=UPI00210401E9|nr:class I SAM-dependent methyltransferase [Arthrobacter sp. zg-Y1171]MCQ1994915.1 class I SAM-dependent methyltransferase [Arthrobacter sp. zg-Y1171]UWX81022.1 class I SAM-dependent methyltransferase [Arthrobacter sp. zg-Y1171]
MPELHIGNAFDDGAADFERLAPSLWNPMGNALVAAADITLGNRVLDAGCGTGASTIPAAQFAGPDGVVDGVDLSAGMLALTQAKADTLSLNNVHLAQADLTSWQAEEPYDAVVCAYSLFFVPEMDAGAAHLVSLLRSGGRFALSTWAEGSWEPFRELLWKACLQERPDLDGLPQSGAENVQRLQTPEQLTSWLESLGLTEITVAPTPGQVQLSPSLAWSLVLGGGYRMLLPEDPAAVDRVRTAFLAELGDDFALNTDTLIATAVRP